MVAHSMIGQILQSFGRIAEDDVEVALEHQKTHGGYFGEALLALGLVTREELDWGLASQFDIPYVFPEANNIDREVAHLVSAEWALTNLAVPVMRSGDTLNVVVDTPMWTAGLEELQNQTGLKIELGLAPASAIRDVIAKVYAGAPELAVAAPPTASSFEALVRHALLADAARFGISVRSGRASCWWEDGEDTRRQPLDAGWRAELSSVAVPPLPPGHSTAVARWAADLVLSDITVSTMVRLLSSPGGEEYVFEIQQSPETEAGLSPPDQDVLSEIRLLVGSGSARFIVVMEPEDLASRILPFLPGLLLDTNARSVTLVDSDLEPHMESALVRTVPSDPEARRSAIQELEDFRFDAVSAALSGDVAEWLDPVLDVARTVFLRWRTGQDREAAYDAGIRWELRVTEAESGRLLWALSPLRR